MNLLSVDPGGRHCGFAIWELHKDPLTEGTRWRCREMHELGPEEFMDQARFWIQDHVFDRVVAEAFTLQPDKMHVQIGSSFPTVEVIGTLRSLCRWNNVPFDTVTAEHRAACFKKMKAVKFRFGRDPDGHMKSAVCVGAVATDWRAINFREGDGVG